MYEFKMVLHDAQDRSQQVVEVALAQALHTATKRGDSGIHPCIAKP
ncbi:MAG: hypothetical protein JO189_06145 [Deltaproteobacteria bacterium]|nr:hypothetical protein [Deltaproteobacteria bacterium]